MLDNLQVHYLRKLENAMEFASHGNIPRCLDMLFELRLRTDLAFFTRAYVNLVLVDLTKPGQHPRRLEFAKEAHRLAEELNETVDQTTSSLMVEQYASLLESSRTAVERVAKEEDEFLQARKGLEGDMEKLQLQDEEEDDDQEPILVYKGDGPTGGWDIEGVFSLKEPGGTKADPAASPKSGSSKTETDLEVDKSKKTEQSTDTSPLSEKLAAVVITEPEPEQFVPFRTKDESQKQGQD